MPFPGRPRKSRKADYKVKFKFTYADYSRLLGIPENTLYQWRHRGKFDPTSLADVVRLYEELVLARRDD